MKVFLDFDDVIFNTKQFKHDFKNMFLEHGVSNEIFDKYYNDPNDTRAIKTFDPWLQIKRINNDLGIDVDYLRKLVSDYISDMSSYVFDDVLEFVKSVGSENVHVVSFGEKEFQTKKIANSGIGKFIPEIIITQDSKSEVVSEIFEQGLIRKDEKIFFLDDRTEQIQDIKTKFPEIVTIFIKRPEGRYQEMCKDGFCDYEAHSLEEAQGIIFSL